MDKNLRMTLMVSLLASAMLAGCTTTEDTPDDGETTPPVAPPTAPPADGPPGSPPVTPPASPPALTGCVPADQEKEDLDQAGSSTVLPIAAIWSEKLSKCIGARIVVAGGGTGSGMGKFCRGEIDIGDASRPISASEKSACAAKGIEPFEVQVAIDGLAIVVSDKNTFAHDITVAELQKIYSADNAKNVDRWNELRPEWPSEKIQIYAPGTDSGTYDYFREVIIRPVDGATAEGRSPAQGVFISEDDNVLVNGVEGSAYAIGYFGMAYVSANEDIIRALPVDDGVATNGAGPIDPTNANVEEGLYKPLARPLFMYVDGKPTGTLQRYFQQGLSDAGQDYVEKVGYIPLPAAKRTEMLEKVA